MLVDFGGGVIAPQDIPKYSPTAPVAIGSPPGPAASSNQAAYTPSATAATVSNQSPMKDVIKQAILNDPAYLQQMDWQKTDSQQRLDRLIQDQGFATQEFALRASGLSGGGGGGSAGLAQAEAIDKLAKEKAAHDYANQQEYVREALASRGMADSGQNPVEQGELTYNYNMLLKELDLRAEARRAQAAASASAGSAASSQASARLGLDQAQSAVYYQRAMADEATSNARSKGKIVNDAGQSLAQAWWDPGTSEYVGPLGERWDRFGNPVGAAAAASSSSSAPAAPAWQSPVDLPPPPAASMDAANRAYALSNTKQMGL